MSAPLTMSTEREAWYRSEAVAKMLPLYVPDLLAELDATRARLAEVERERDEANRNWERVSAMVQAERDRAEAAEARLARLRPLVRGAVALWRDGPVVSPLGRSVAEGVEHMDPSDRQWAMEEEER